MNAVLQEFSPAFGSYPALKPLLAQQQVLPYPIECLPQILKQAVIEVQGYVQAPMSLVACNALAIASLVTQGLATIRRDTYLISPLSLFILSIADSGERKTFAESFFLNPIENLIAKQYQQMRPKLSQYEADLESWDAQKKGLKLKIQKVAKDSDENALQDAQKELQTLVDAKPKEPLIPKLKYSDVTIQAVTEGLRHYPSAGLLVSEGGIFFGGAGFQSDSAMTTLSILNDLWSGSALTIDRKGEGSIRLSDVALMMNIAVQSEVLRKFLTRTGQLARGSGFLARPLITMPESTQGFRPYKPPPELRALEQLISKFESLLLLQSSHLNDQGTLERITLELAPKARECWVAYYNEIEQAQQVGKYAEFIKAEASKSADNASRIAGIFHILEYGLTGTVSEQTMEQACR
jgi:putative DNA primase/helicase